MMKKRYHLNLTGSNLLHSTLVVALFTSIHCEYIFKSTLSLAVRYIISILCFLIAVTNRNVKRTRALYFLTFLTAVTGLVNYFCIGNTTLLRIVNSVMCFFIGVYLLSPNVHSMALCIATYAQIIIILLAYLMTRSMDAVYPEASTNYISIMLLLPAVVYYAKCKQESHKAETIPALLIFLLCVLAIGRGGILSSGFLLIAVLMERINRIKSRSIVFLVKTAIVFVILYCFLLILSEFSVSGIIGKYLKRFGELGISDNGRFDIWEKYISKARENTLYILWGAPLDQIPRIVAKQGNVHSSYLSIHAYNGLIAMVTIVLWIFRIILKNIKEKQYMVFACFMVLLFRGFTDRIFWGTTGSIVLAFFLFYVGNLKSDSNQKIFLQTI